MFIQSFVLQAKCYLGYLGPRHTEMASKTNKQRNGERERISEKVTIELQDWHPTPRSDVNCPNYQDAAPLRLDTTWSDLPKLAPNVGGPKVRFTSLV